MWPGAGALLALPKGGSARTGPLPLHPMTVSDILDGAFRLLKANARVLLPIVAVFVVPLQVIGAWAQRDLLGGDGLLDALSDPSLAAVGSSFQGGEGAVVAGLLNLLVLPFLAGAVSQVVASSYLGHELGVGDALRATFRRAGALFVGWIVVHLLEVAPLFVLGTLLFGLVTAGAPGTGIGILVLLGFLVALPWLVAVMALSVAVAPAIVVEHLGPVAATRRSWSLVRRRFWPVLGVALLAGLVANLLGQVLGFIPSLGGLLVGAESGWALLAVGSILTAMITQPIVAIVATLQYFDARIRFEGFDLEVIAAELGAPGTSR